METLNSLGNQLKGKGEFEEANEVWERCLAGWTKVLGEYHSDTLGSLCNLGVLYDDLKNYEKALDFTREL